MKLLIPQCFFQANEFFFFAGLILLNMIIFTAMVRRYKFVVMEVDSFIAPSFLISKQDQEDYCPLIKLSDNKELIYEYSVSSSPSSITTSITSDP